MREKVGKSRNTVFFQWFVAPEGRKVGSLKRRVRSQLARWVMNSCTPLWREADFQVKMYKTHQLRTTFGSWDVKKSARRCGAKHISKSKCTKHTRSGPLLKLRCRKSARRCGAKHISKSKCTKHTDASDHFWRFRCRKSARRCGAKHISKSKCTKHHMFAPLLEVRMLKKCTSLWREAHFEVKVYKTPHVRATFGGSDVASLYYTTLHYTTLHSTRLRSTTLHYITQHYNYNYTTTLHYTPLH